ncbi:MAG: hypothetical protein HY812_00250 [Planctomycetes bacterium]|nr:hypothetical protein [Planctomycetota bacterium]
MIPLIGPFGPLPLCPGGPGGGSVSVEALVPAACAFAIVTMQAFVDDPVGAAGLSATNGLEVRIE